MAGGDQEQTGETGAAAAASTAAASAPAEEQRCCEPEHKKLKPDDVRCGTISYVLTDEEHKALLVLEQSYPDWPNPRTAPPKVPHGRKWASIAAEMQARSPGLNAQMKVLRGICTRGKQKRELRKLRAFRTEHELKAGRKVADGTADPVRQEELDKLSKRLEMIGKENADIRQGQEDAEKHVAILKSVVGMKDAEIRGLKLQLQAEKRKVSVLGKQLRVASDEKMELQRMLCEETEDTQGAEEAGG